VEKVTEMERTYLIWRCKEIELPYLPGSKTIERSISIRWSPAETRIISCRLYFKGKTPAWFTHLKYYMNENEICDWYPLDERSAYFNAHAYLINGLNAFKCWMKRNLIGGGKVHIDSWLVIEYEGEEPKERPGWYEYLPYALAYITVSGAGASIYGVVRKK